MLTLMEASDLSTIHSHISDLFRFPATGFRGISPNQKEREELWAIFSAHFFIILKQARLFEDSLTNTL
ncbi:hypothetical protein BH20ACI2_BH20ACI2_18120 [soil metagenome]